MCAQRACIANIADFRLLIFSVFSVHSFVAFVAAMTPIIILVSIEGANVESKMILARLE